MTKTDQGLLLRWRQGERDAGTELFRRNFARVRRFFRTKVDPADVEDMVQRTFTVLVEGRDRLRREEKFNAFLYGIARRLLLQYLRERMRASAEAIDMTTSSIQAFGITPSSLVAARQEHAWLHEALRRIPVQFQIMLELSYWEEMPGPEIADILGISPTTVRTRLFRAREALEQKLRDVVGIAEGEQLPFDVGTVARSAGRIL